jgi:hypothetical protein
MISESNPHTHHHEILLFDPHGEYTGCLNNLPNYDREAHAKGIPFTDTWLRCQMLWDGYSIVQTAQNLGLANDVAEDRVNEAFHLIFDDKLDDLIQWATPADAMIMKLSGASWGLRRAFDALFNALDSAPSGDDDFFDYWPNTMDMLYTFATDLDAIFEGPGGFDGFRVKVAEMAQKIYTECTADGRDHADEWGHAIRWPNPMIAH